MAPSPGDPLWPDLQRARRVIVVADVVESVRLLQQDELGAIDRWRRFVNEVRAHVLPAYGGRLVKSLGDGLLLEFDSVPAAVAASLDLQQRVAAGNPGLDRPRAMQLRIGVHAADVIVDELDVYGAGVNLAARLGTLAGPGEVVVSADVRDQLVCGLDAEVEDLGECFLKHIQGQVRAYRVGPPSPVTGRARDSSLRRDEGLAIAVIPFVTHADSPEGQVVGDILADELIANLSRATDVRVISRLSTAAFQGRATPLRDIAARLAAAYVLSGRALVGRRGDLQVMVELADTRDDSVLMANRYKGHVPDLLCDDGELVGRLLADLSRAIFEREVERARTHALPSLHSHSVLLSAVALMHRARAADFERARLLLEHLAQREPQHSAAYAWMAKWHVLRVVQGWSADRHTDTLGAQFSVRRALGINAESALALSIDGLVRAYLEKDLAGAGRSYRAALDINPNEPLAWLFSSTLHAYRGEAQAAEATSNRALSLSPLDPMKYFFDSLAATAALANSNWQRSIELANRSLRGNRTHASTWRTLVGALVMAGRLPEARSAAQQLLSIEPGLTVSGFRERFPGRDGPMAEPLAAALAAAGVPP
jgi:class 3 adenylate cyclase/tetratricopeptide (TPR) repeat protein